MRLTFYYTIITCKTFFMVKYTLVPEGRILTFPGTFDSYAEAEEQFKKSTHGKVEKLSEGTFQHKAETMAAHYQQDLAMLQSWIDGKGISV